MEFQLPVETGEQLAFGAAVFTVMIGLMMAFAPGFSLRILGFARPEGSTAAYSEMRSSLGGFYIGTGLTALLMGQPFLYFGLGASFAIAAFARVISILSDRGTTLRNYILLVVQIGLAGLPISYAIGYLAG